MPHARTLAALGAIALLCNAAHAQTQTFPNKPLRIIMPFPAGGSVNDVLGRALAQQQGNRQVASVALIQALGGGWTSEALRQDAAQFKDHKDKK